MRIQRSAVACCVGGFTCRWRRGRLGVLGRTGRPRRNDRDHLDHHHERHHVDQHDVHLDLGLGLGRRRGTRASTAPGRAVGTRAGTTQAGADAVRGERLTPSLAAACAVEVSRWHQRRTGLTVSPGCGRKANPAPPGPSVRSHLFRLRVDPVSSPDKLARSPRNRLGPRRTASIAPRGEIAQLVEHTTENRGVPGSNPGLAIVVVGAMGDRRLASGHGVAPPPSASRRGRSCPFRARDCFVGSDDHPLAGGHGFGQAQRGVNALPEHASAGSQHDRSDRDQEHVDQAGGHE
jgi:hypothetical protein